MKTYWGILSTAKIGLQKVIPAIQKANNCEVVAIASRDQKRAEQAAKQLNIPKWYGSYEALLADTDIDVIYNPLPNHLHVPLTIEAMKAGKHVLCEKPIGLNTANAMQLIEYTQKFPSLKVMEAFMYRFHPQWKKAKELVLSGEIGKVKTVHSFFSYYNIDPNNIRNISEVGGGALMDIGCYCISFPRFIFDLEPKRVISLIDFDPKTQTDRLSSGMLDFSRGINSTFTCSTQLMPYQRAQIVGTKGRIEIEVPVNAPPDVQAKIYLFTPTSSKEFSFEIIDQYTLQAQEFANAVIHQLPVPTPLTDALNNMQVIDALFESGKKNNWVNL